MSVSVSDVSEESSASAPPEAMRAPVPDRADAPVSETAERFLRAVVAEVPLELIEELHLFSPLRQGTVETGIAVLAARRPAPEPVAEPEETEPDAEPELALGGVAEVEAEAEAVGAEAPDAEAPTAEAPTAEAATAEAEVTDAETAEAVVAETPDAPTDGDATAGAALAGADSAGAVHAVPSPAPVRHTVFTARYRYVIKGPERGKWESNLKAEADAPLVTVETVVRGVQRRAGEESEIVRYTADQIARALRIILPG